jgi:hypothetical protein
MHDAVHRNNVNQRESSEATSFPLLISAIDEMRYTQCEQGQRARRAVMILELKQGNSRARWMLMIWLLAMPLTSSMEAGATTMYSYIDDQGTPVITDNFNTIPERYRSKVKTTEQISNAPQSASTAGAIHERVTSWQKRVTDMVSRAVPNISGLSASQSKILTYAGVAAIVLFIAMYMSKGQSIRLLALWCLIMLGLGTPVLLYISNDGPMDVIQKQAAQTEKKHQDRLQQIP